MLVFVDESAKDRNSSRRRRSWSKRGQTPFRDAYLASASGPRYTLIAACDLDGFILEACQTVEREHGAADRDPTRGTVDGERFKLWLKEKLCPVLGNYERCEPRSLVALDNATVHHVDGVVELIEATGAKVIFLAPYAPEYNPIETMFHLYKSSLRRLQYMSWIDAHVLSLESVTPAKARALFRHACVPACEHFADSLTEEEEAMVCAVTAIVGIICVRKRKRNM